MGKPKQANGRVSQHFANKTLRASHPSLTLIPATE